MPSADPEVAAAGGGGLGDVLGGLFGSGGAQEGISGGLGELIDNLSQSGQEDVAKSWVETGPNKQIGEPELATALGQDTLQQLSQTTGLSQEELLSRLKSILPTAVDKFTPEGRLPSQREISQWSV
jgi:uncharacterized protein YidB (DUF937 family)